MIVQINILLLLQENKFDESARKIIVEWQGRRINPNEIPIERLPPPLVADFKADVRTGFPPLKVKFTDLSTGDPDNWYWDFGNGVTSQERSPEIIFNDPGVYDVSLNVRKGGHNNPKRQPSFITVKDSLKALGCPIGYENEISGNKTFPKLDGGGVLKTRHGGSLFFNHIEDQRRVIACAKGDVTILGYIQDQASVDIYALGRVYVDLNIQSQAAVNINSKQGIEIKGQIREQSTVSMCTNGSILVRGGVHDTASVFLDGRTPPVYAPQMSNGALVQGRACSNL